MHIADSSRQDFCFLNLWARRQFATGSEECVVLISAFVLAWSENVFCTTWHTVAMCGCFYLKDILCYTASSFMASSSRLRYI